MVTGSFVCGCGRTFGHSGDTAGHKNIAMVNPLHQNNQSFIHCGCGRLFHTKGDLTRHQDTVPAEIVSLPQFRSRALLLPLDRPLKVNVEGRSPG